LSSLSRQAGQKALAPIQQAIDSDPEREVKRRAVSALQQMPNGEGIPMLIQVARNSKDADVRKQAMNSLGQSRDQRAISFFEEVLKAKP
jgi:HEAT repeat protein